MAVNILLADDHRMVREGLKQLLETDSEINVVAEAGDGYECLNLTNKTKPDIVLLDINMPNMDGIQVLNIMKQQKMLCKVIVLTIHNEIEYLVKALEIGCDGRKLYFLFILVKHILNLLLCHYLIPVLQKEMY